MSTNKCTSWNFIDLTGQEFANGNIKVIKRASDYIQPSGQKKVRWECKCICGNIFITYGNYLKNGHTKSCGCLKKDKLIDLTGMVFGRLTVIERDEDYISPKGEHNTKWKCQCICGNIVSVLGRSLKDKITKSCVCLTKKYNTYDLTGEYGIGYSSNTNEKFYFDLEDYDKIKDYSWYVNSNGYLKNSNDVYMHRLLMNFPKNKLIDHINHKRYDNRKKNLRIVNSSQNNKNRIINKKNCSGVLGVYYGKNINKWIANIRIDGKTKYLGCYEDKEDAIKARKEAEDKYYGEYSYDNSMKGDENNE